MHNHNNIEVKEVKSRRDLKKFIDFPHKLYAGEPNWVHKLDIDIKGLLSEKNPFYRHAWKKLFLVEEKGRVKGRSAAIIDYNFIDFQGENTGFFGFFESVDEIKIADALLSKCESVLKKKGMNKIIGPMNPSSNDEMGFLFEGYDSPPRVMMPYNYSYYHRLMESCGYTKQKDLLALNMKVSEDPKNRLESFVKKIKKRNPQLNCRPINKKKFKEEVNLIRNIYNSAWEKNWAFVPWTDAEIEYIAKQLKMLVVEDLAQIAFFDDDPAGFLLALPDYNEVIKKTGRKLFPFNWIKFILKKNDIKNLRLMAMGVKKKYQNKGAGAFMYYKSLLAAIEKGYQECEFSWVLEDNYDTIKIGRMMGGSIYKKYRVFGKDLT
ncbi:MAG: hypothetical protein ACQESB_00725 [Elusimicrobiota bacterium]